MLLIVALILFVLLVVVHEYGHFLVAKRNGVEVEEFGIGFPPKIAGKKMGKGIFEGYYTINWLPLGGFVKLKGETDADKRKGSFGAASFWVKTKIILAGVAMNFIAAAAIFTILAWSGIPSLVPNQYGVESDRTLVEDSVAVVVVQEGSPAEAAGLNSGDRILSLSGVDVESSEQLFELTEQYAGQEVSLTYVQDGETIERQVTLNDNQDNSFLGVGPSDIEVNRYTWSAPLVGVGTTLQLSALTYQGLADIVGNIFSGNVSEAGEGIAGPVGIVVILTNVGAFGAAYMLFFIGIISLTLAVMNSLPIPALDGGRLFVSGLFKVINKPLTPEMEQRIHGTGFAFLLMLIILITWVDIGRIFG